MVKKDKIKFSEDQKEELGTQKNHFFPIELFESLKNAWVI